MSADEADRTDAFFHALASKSRRDILRILAATGAGDGSCCGSDDVCACDFTQRLGLGAPTVSHHMRVLRDAGLVTSTKRGAWVHYRLVPERVAEALGELREFMPRSD